MKKTVSGFMGLMCCIPFMAGAVAWQMDSNQFRWSAVSTTSPRASAAFQNVIQCKADIAGGTVTIRYNLPSSTKGAKLRIYGISGKPVRDFDLQPGSRTVQWDIAKENIAAGIYVACMPFGSVDKKAVIAIVK
jgi:hypothetical protein